MSSERLQILNMVRDRKITVEEGNKLLEVLYTENPTRNSPKWIKIKVTDTYNNDKINISLPASLFSLGVKFAEKFSPEFKESGLTENDIDKINAIINSGVTGKVVDIQTAKGEKVEVIVE